MTSYRRKNEVISMEMEGSTTHMGIDEDKAEAFGIQMLTMLNNGALALMISLGHKTGLFESMAKVTSVTSTELAKAHHFHERYIREWLDTMYTGGIVEIQDTKDKYPTTRYYLPPESAAFLTWGRGPENVAVLSQYISILSTFEEKTIECMRTGKGIASNEFGELKSVMAADAAQTIASSLINWILPLEQGRVISDLRAGIDVLDISCGTGINLITLAKEFPRSWFTGYDSNAAHIAVARDAIEKENLQNVRFKCVQITDSMETAAYDLITCFGGLVETGDVRNVISRVYQALRRSGTFLLQDIAANSDPRKNRSHPAGPLLYTISTMYSVPSTLYKTGNDQDAVGLMWGNDRALELIKQTGFKCHGARKLPADNCNVFFFCIK